MQNVANMDEALRHHFPLLEQPGVYLNHAAMGPWARDTSVALCAFAEENTLYGARNYAAWMQREDKLHQDLARFIGAASSDDIALCKNTSEGLSLIAEGLDWQVGDEIVIPTIEFPSNRLPWIAQQQAHGAVVKEVVLDGDDPEASLIAACGPKTRLLSVSAVQYGNGLRMDLARLGTHCREHGILFCIDAIQQLGALPLDVQAVHCDFLVADAHKWLLGPEGIAVFYTHLQSRKQLRQCQHGWRMYTDPFYFERSDWQPPPSAKRFEPGSPNMMGIVALSAALTMFEHYGMELVTERLLAVRDELAQGVSALPQLQLLSDNRPQRRSGIISFAPREGLDSVQLHQRLLNADVFGAHRGGAIRWSPHFYQSVETAQQALRVLRACLEDISA